MNLNSPERRQHRSNKPRIQTPWHWKSNEPPLGSPNSWNICICNTVVTMPPQVCHRWRLVSPRTNSTNQMKNKKIKWTAAGALASVAFGTGAMAQSSDALLDKLVEKGILTTKEANELKEETDKGFTTAYQVKSGMPDWVTALKFNGDFRGRFEGFYADNPAFVDRNRFRYRVRFGATATLLDDFEIGLRLSSADPVSGSSV